MFYVTNCHLEDTSWKVRIQRGAWEQPYEKRASWTIHATSFQVCDTSRIISSVAQKASDWLPRAEGKRG